jgi:radical SAM/Cys-rich protein
MEKLPEFFREHQIQLVASMPCYLEENVCAQRGVGVYQKSIEVIKRLNALDYGSNPELPLNLVYNPGGPFLPPPQLALEEDYRRELGHRFGITFTRLLTITNMPLGRFRKELFRKKEDENYLRLLRESFNPQTITGLMCRHQISVGWDGTLYDCDFNLALGLSVNHGAPDHIQSFRLEDLWKRRIVTGEHCFACTAGSGSSCGGALV